MNELATRRLPLVGREVELTRIRQAIQGQGPAIVYLEGVAGIGKTMLLEEAGSIALQSGALCPAILDFYDTRMHSHQGLEAAIANDLDPQRERFSQYWQQREREPQAELWGLFLEGYAAVARGARIVLRFDTTERLEYERDSEEVRRDCEVTEEDAPSWSWLLNRIGALPNTVVLIAARPTESGMLRQRLLDQHHGKVVPLEISGLNIEETRAYFCATPIGTQVHTEAPEVIDRIHRLTNGRPILIALALDWLERGMWDRHTLEGIADRDFEIALVEQIRSLTTPLDKAVLYAALCRKGCNAELLARLMGISLQEAEALVVELLKLSFVKPPRPGSRGMFFLHDEMYDLVEKYVWLPMWPDYSEQARLDQVVITWYDEQIEKLRQRIRDCPDWRERSELRREQQLLMTEQLYYQFDRDPRIGYREYSHMDEEAIRERELEWDTWLRNEALWFTSHRAWRRGDPNNVDPNYPRRDPAWQKNGRVVRSPAVDHDCRRQWINRYIAKDRTDKAAHVAERLLASERQDEEPELYRGGVQIALATAQAYQGGLFIEAALQNFDKGIKQLESVEEKHREPWLHPYLLGTAYLYKGMALRSAFGLAEVCTAYGQATYYYRQIRYLPGLAEAMNNLAYVMARQGKLKQALASCEEALKIRERLGDEYSLGLSLNTKGIILERLNRPVTAISYSEQALNIFKEAGKERGMILAEINLGRAHRRKGRSPDWGQRDEDFAAGERYLQDAIHRQDKQGPAADVYYRIEAHNELGCLYRDWVATLYAKAPDDARLEPFLDQAEQHLHYALTLAQGEDAQWPLHPLQYIDSLEDLARVHYWRARVGHPCEEGEPLSVMERLLNKAEELARKRLRGWEELRLIMGKIHFQRARLAQESRNNAEVARHYALAAGYAESYSLDAPELEKFVSDACDWLNTLDVDEAEKSIATMRGVLKKARLKSSRLQDWINGVVPPRLGVGWEGKVEASRG